MVSLDSVKLLRRLFSYSCLGVSHLLACFYWFKRIFILSSLVNLFYASLLEVRYVWVINYRSYDYMLSCNMKFVVSY